MGVIIWMVRMHRAISSSKKRSREWNIMYTFIHEDSWISRE